MKKVFWGVLVLVTMASCNSSQKKNAEQIDETTVAVEQPADNSFYGFYEGTLPAADCEGIKTSLTVNDDKTYSLKSEYIGVENGTFETNGVYNLIDDSLIELITPSSGEKTYYKILYNNQVMLSDSAGTINQGELAAYYILKKK